MKSLLSSTLWNRIPTRCVVTGLSKAQPLAIPLDKWGISLTRRWSTTATSTVVQDLASPLVVDPATLQRPPSFTRPQVVRTEDGREMLAFDMRPHPKLKPSIVARRISKLRTYIGNEKDIRHSPWRLNLVCQFAAGMTLQEALKQLDFSKKSKAPLVKKVLKRTSNLADIRDGLQISQLEVAECFATKGKHLKRLKIMSRGQAGRKERKHSHMRVVLREIDFPLKIYQAKSLAQKKRWYLLQQQAEKDYARRAAEREETKRLEEKAAAK